MDNLFQMLGKALEYVLNKYPDQSARVIELYSTDEDFRILCNDILATGEALEQCRQNALKDREYENEFLQVFLDLEKEVDGLLKRTAM